MQYMNSRIACVFCFQCDLHVQVMKVVNDLIKVPELNQTMQQMSREMMKAGLIEETMGEMVDDALDTDDIEEDADAEVDKVNMPPTPHQLFEMDVRSRGVQMLLSCLQCSTSCSVCKLPGTMEPVLHLYWCKIFSTT